MSEAAAFANFLLLDFIANFLFYIAILLQIFSTTQ